MTLPLGSRSIAPLLARLARLRRVRPRGRGFWLLVIVAGLAIIPPVLGHWPTTGLRHGLRPEIPSTLAPARDAAAPPGSRLRAHEAAAQAETWGRRILRQATLTIELGDVERAVGQLAELVEAAGGYVADTQSHADASGVLRATVTVYVPPVAFGRALRELEQLGRVTSRRIGGQDVSEEFVDLEARVRNLERHEAQLLAFMAKAHQVSELVALENELARVRGEVERLTGRLRFLRARSEMAAIQVGLVRHGGGAASDGILARAWERVRQDFVAGWRAAFEVAIGLAALAAQLSPLAVAAAVAWGLYRRLRRQPASVPAPLAS
jgi:uncharacterized protein DUF4349